jgi:hypothetical protein
VELDLCNGRFGCVAVAKFMIWIPMKDPNGAPDLDKELFELKTILVYKDYITIYHDN